MGEVDYRLVDELNEKQQALEDREAAARRREAALRLPPLPSGHRDPNAPRTDAPDKAGGGRK